MIEDRRSMEEKLVGKYLIVDGPISRFENIFHHLRYYKLLPLNTDSSYI
jgi:hypothetical protein